MTRTLLILGMATMVAYGATAQDPLSDYVLEERGDTLVVASLLDVGVPSTLSAVIAADTGAGDVPEGRVYMLRSGTNEEPALYPLDAALGAQGRPLTIVGEFCALMVQGSDTECRPPSISGWSDASNTPQFTSITVDDDITMKNLHFTNAHDQGAADWSFVNVRNNDTVVRLENVLGEHNRWTHINANEFYGTEIYISDSYFVNATDQNSRRNGGIYDNVQSPTGVMWVENTTHVQNAGMQYKFRDFSPDEIKFNHNTFVNSAGQVFLSFGYLTNFAATNNLIVNSNYQPYYPGLDSGEMYTNPAELPVSAFQPHGIINLAPLLTNNGGQSVAITPDGFATEAGNEPFAEADRQVLVDANVAYWDPLLLTIDDDLNAAGAEGDICANDGCIEGDASLQWVDQAILADEQTMSIFMDDDTYPLITWGTWYQDGAPGFVNGPGMVQELYNWGFNSSDSDVSAGDNLPKVRTADNMASASSEGFNWVFFDWPIPLDLSYSNETYLDGGYNNFPVGDLNWFPSEKTAWMGTRDAEYDAINNALATGMTLLPTAGERAPSRIGRLGQNQPNPFGGTTTIEFELVEASDVTLEVFDALGRRVATLVDLTLPAGAHSVDWNAGSLSSGVYVYTLRAGSTIESRRMVIAR